MAKAERNKIMATVERNGKTLYHVQSLTEWHDDPYDMFVWGKDCYEVEKGLRKLYEAELEGIDNPQEIIDLVNNSNVYTIYTSEV